MRSSGSTRHGLRSAKNENEGAAMALYNRSSRYGRSHGINHSEDSNPVLEDGNCKPDMQDVVDTLPIGAGTERCNTWTPSHKIQASSASRQTKTSHASSSETYNCQSIRRKKRCKLSTHGSDLSPNLTERDARRQPGHQQFANDVGKEGSSSASVDNSETKKRHGQREKTSLGRVRPNVTDTKHVQSDCAKDKLQGHLVCSGSAGEVTEVSKSTPRLLNKHVHSVSADVERQQNLQNTQDSCGLQSYSSLFQPSGRKSSSAAKSCNRRQPIVEDVTAHDAEAKLSDREKKVGVNKLVKTAQRGKNAAAPEKVEVTDEVLKGGDVCRKDVNQTSQDKPRRSTEYQQSLIRGKASRGLRRPLILSTHVSADYQRSTSKLKGNSARELDDRRVAVADGDLAQHQYGESQLKVPVHSFDTQEHSTKCVVIGAPSSSLKKRYEEVCTSEDWEAELFTPSQCNMTVSGRNAKETCHVEEAVKIPMYKSSATGSAAATDSTARPLSSLATQSVEKHHNYPPDLSSSAEVKTAADCGEKQTWSEVCDAVEAKKYAIHAKATQANETSDLSVSFKCNVIPEREVDVSEYGASTVNCGKSDMDTCDRNLSSDGRQRICVPLPRSAESSDVLSDSAAQCEQSSVSDEIIEPYEIEADGCSCYLQLQYDKSSYETFIGKQIIVVILLFSVAVSTKRQ